MAEEHTRDSEEDLKHTRGSELKICHLLVERRHDAYEPGLRLLIGTIQAPFKGATRLYYIRSFDHGSHVGQEATQSWVDVKELMLHVHNGDSHYIIWFPYCRNLN